MVARCRIPNLSFIGPGGYRSLKDHLQLRMRRVHSSSPSIRRAEFKKDPDESKETTNGEHDLIVSLSRDSYDSRRRWSESVRRT